MSCKKKLESITQMEQESLGTLLELPELPKVPRMGLLLRHGAREEQEMPETEPVPEETAAAAEDISAEPVPETPVTKAPAAPEPEAYSVDEILREVHGGAPQADNAPTPAAPVYSGARVLERLLDDPEKLASDLDALTRAIQGLSDDLRRGAAESRKGRWTDEEHLEYLSRRLAAADGQCGGGGGAAGVVPGAVSVCLVQHPVQLGPLTARRPPAASAWRWPARTRAARCWVWR